MISRKILLVEDDEDTIETLCSLLRAENFLVETALNGREALEKLKTTSKPDMILLDYVMPIMGGAEFLKHIHKNRDIFNGPIVVFTAADETVKIEGATLVVKKPIEMDELIRIAHKYCHKNNS